MSTPFLVPFVAPNPDSWGPRGFYEDENNPDSSPRSGKFLDLPYSPFGRSDRLGRAADFTNLNRGDRSRFNRQGRYEKSERNSDRRYNKNNDNNSDAEEETFQLVDTSKATTSMQKQPVVHKQTYT